MNQLYYGDNLQVLRGCSRFPHECAGFIFLAPPFNSKRDYNLLFKSPVASVLRADGSRATGSTLHSQAQITIEGLLNHTHRTEHPDHQPDLNFKKTKAEANAA